MKKASLSRITRFVAGMIAISSAQFAATAQVPEFGAVTAQNPCNRAGSGSNAFHFLVMEGESYFDNSKLQDPSNGLGFQKVYNDGTNFSLAYSNAVLATNTSASLQGAIFAVAPNFTRFFDKVTYQVVFSEPGDYYMYMRYTEFESGVNLANYGNEDSFVFPPDFNKDPQSDWDPPGSVGADDGGYIEGFGAHGFNMILNYHGDTNGPGAASRTEYHTAANTNFWEGNFHWTQLFISSFLNGAITNADGTPRAGTAVHYVVTPGMVGIPQNFTIAYREQGVAIDQWLFSTHTNLLNDYMQQELDDLFVNKVAVQQPENTVVTPTNTYPFLEVEGENFIAKTNRNLNVGFAAVTVGSTNVAFYGSAILATNTTSSHKGALFAVSPNFTRFFDKVAYRMTFSQPGDYYVYMRYTEFESGVNLANYGNEDSFIFPPDFNKDPQFDWVPQGTTGADDGGYIEGFGAHGFNMILDYHGDTNGPGAASRTEYHTAANTNVMEGTFHWTQLFISSFLNGAITNADGTPRAGNAVHYVVTPGMVGIPQSFTIAFREQFVAIDQWLFSTHTNLLNDYTQAQLDQQYLSPGMTISSSGGNVVVSWPASASCFILESTPSLSPVNWTAVQQGAALSGSRYNLTLTGPTGNQYFRLRQP
jgi:hypothetical protein